MVASTITIEPIHLDCSDERFALSGGVASLEDDTVVHESENRLTTTNEKSHVVRGGWQLSWGDAERDSVTDSEFLMQLFRVCRNSKGFLFVSPMDNERVATAQIMRNTATDGLVGDGSTTTFQLQRATTVAHTIGGGSASSDYTEVNYPMNGTVTAYKNGVSAAFTVNYTTGVVTFSTAPGVGVVASATFEYAIPVYIVSPTISRSMIEATNTEVRSIQIKEIL